MPEPLDPTTIAADLRTGTLPRAIRCLDSVGSTMDVARELLPITPAMELPLLVTADVQTQGRGRLGRRWEAPPGTALLLSLALRPTWLPPDQGAALVWMTATALCEAVEDVTDLHASLKWPNDLLLPVGDSKAKAAGILLEVSLSANAIEWAIIGCGVNVSAAPPREQTRYPATSVAEASGRPVSRLELLRALLRRLDRWHGLLLAGNRKPLFEAWRSRLGGIGEPVRVETPAGPVEGRAEGVDSGGALLVRDSAGRVHTITAGDVGLAP